MAATDNQTANKPDAGADVASRNGDELLWYVARDGQREDMHRWTLRMLARFYTKYQTQPAIVYAHREDIDDVGDVGIEVKEGRIPSRGQVMIGYINGHKPDREGIIPPPPGGKK